MKICGFYITRDPWYAASPRSGYLIRMLHHNSQTLERLAMVISNDVQQLVDAVAANKDGVAAAIQGLQAEAAQIADLKAQLAAVTPGQPIDAEDLTAIQKAVTDLADTNSKLQTAVPANVPPTPAPPPAA